MQAMHSFRMNIVYSPRETKRKTPTYKTQAQRIYWLILSNIQGVVLHKHLQENKKEEGTKTYYQTFQRYYTKEKSGDDIPHQHR